MSNNIHPTAIISPSVKLGKNNYIGPYCVITGNTIIGDSNRFEAYCSIGTPAEHRDYFHSHDGRVEIGNNNVFREYTTVNAGTAYVTTIHDHVVMLRGSHVGHDSVIKSKVNLSCNALIGGHSQVEAGANFGLGAICHQFSKIGAYSMIGMGSVITKSCKILPGMIYIGAPAKYHDINAVGLQRNGIDENELSRLTSEFERIL